MHIVIYKYVMQSGEMQRPFSTMPLQAFMEPSEWLIFNEEVANVAAGYPDITGVLAIGSLVQSFRPPVNFYENQRSGPLSVAYESIRHPERRKVFPSNRSDLDIWVAVRDTKESANAEHAVSIAGIALLEELASGAVQRGTSQWGRKKEAAFNAYYKNPALYPRSFTTTAHQGAQPWMATRFKTMVEQAVLHRLPGFAERIARFTEHKIPGDFLEVRAFPESVFNLRPDDVPILGDGKDRQPFPRIADEQWIGQSHASSVLYAADGVGIYPFTSEGRVLGREIHDYMLSREPGPAGRSYGAVLLKPDAIENNQVTIIKEKIVEGVTRFSGKIVLERLFDGLTFEQVKAMYPSLSGQDLDDTTKYLASGRSLGLVIQADIGQDEMLQEVGAIKGPRVGDRTEERLLEGRKLDGSVRDLLPLPGDEDKYRALLPTLFRRKIEPSHRFTTEEYAYYSQNLIHSPDNVIELKGLLNVLGFEGPRC